MKTLKMSLANIQGKLSRAEMKKVMAGSGIGGGSTCSIKCPNSTEAVSISDCSREAATEKCGGDPAGATCNCG